ncbi:MAG: DUF4174 domain-containing protein [Planctomycetota bacterium]|jgi:hypothetical protein
MNIGTTSLKELQDEQNLLYVFSPSKQERLYQLQMDTFADDELVLSEHHVILAEIFEHGQGHLGPKKLPHDNCRGLRQEFHIQPGQFKIVMVGRDSTVKLSAESCISTEEVIMRVENEPEEMESMYY